MRFDELLSKEGKNYFYVMHLSYNGKNRESLWNYARENSIIGLDKPGVVTDDWNEIRESVKDQLSGIWFGQFEMFCNEMKVGDIVVTLEGWHSLLGIAKILRVYRYRGELTGIFFNHVRRVRWIKQYDYGEHPELPHHARGFNNTLIKVEPNKKWWRALVTIEF